MLKDQKSPSARQEKDDVEKKEILKKATAMSYGEIIKNVGELKLAISNALGDNEKALLNEYKKLEDLMEAVKIEEEDLNAYHQIHREAETLEALLQAQKNEREKFEKEMMETKKRFDDEMKEIKTKWEKEKIQMEQKMKENEAQLAKDRKREEEEYAYELKIKRKKEADSYEEKKTILEKELAEKKNTFDKEIREWELSIAERENNLAALQKQVEGFPAELEKAVNLAVKNTTEKLQMQHKFDFEMFKKENEAKINLKDQIIGSLQTKIKEQEQLIKELTTKADKASQQVQDIAIKAIEGSSNIRFNLRELASEKKKEE